MRRRHTPQRTCVACRGVFAKRELVRIVRSPTGKVEVDETGKKPGRGAYLCRRKACWEKALQGKQLEQALKTGISSEDKAALLAFSAQLPEPSEGTPPEKG